MGLPDGYVVHGPTGVNVKDHIHIPCYPWSLIGAFSAVERDA